MTSSQTDSHFLRHEKERWQTGQVFCGRSLLRTILLEVRFLSAMNLAFLAGKLGLWREQEKSQ